jgi:hypothetical protein
VEGVGYAWGGEGGREREGTYDLCDVLRGMREQKVMAL